MIGYFILGVSLLAALLVLGRWLVNADPQKLAQILRFVGAGVLGAVALFFFLTGRFTWGLPLAFLAAAMVRRRAFSNLGGIGGLGGMFGGSRPSGGQASEVETEFLRMTLEHDTGTMRGTVLRGRFAGRQLADLGLEELVELLGECHREDHESAQLLETWLDRTQGPGWREQAGAGAGASGGAGSAPDGGSMTRKEAREILGVGADATADEIREAHRKMMLKHHPDRGGSGYFAAKINQAKELLLSE